MLASSSGQLLHPHRSGAEEQPQREPQGPADLPLHQVRTALLFAFCHPSSLDQPVSRPCRPPGRTSPSSRRRPTAGKTPSATTCASTAASARPATSCAGTARGSRASGTWRRTATGAWRTRSARCRWKRSSSWRGACPTQVRVRDGDAAVLSSTETRRNVKEQTE